MADDNNSKFDLSRIKTINLKNRYEVNNILFPKSNPTRFMNISTFEGYTRQFSNDSLQTILNSPNTTIFSPAIFSLFFCISKFLFYFA